MKVVSILLIIAYIGMIMSHATTAFLHETEEIQMIGLGSIIGKIEENLDGQKYEAFYGIPYGEPPIGDNRFANFKPVKSWNNILKTMEPKSKCIQKNIFFGKNSLVTGEESCLYLNVYRPMVHASQELLPVIVFIHGGGFFAGSAHPDIYGPEKFMKTNRVILVTFQYRLGPLGFFSTNDTAAEGNQGFKDQIGALEFIHKHIKYFNGNPDKITVLGHGAGAASAHLQLTNPRSKGLFNKMILLSGTAIGPYNEPTKDPAEQAYQLAKYAGIKDADQLNTTELVKKLKEIDASVLIEATDDFHTNGIDPVVIFKIVVENPKNENAFITKPPQELSKNGELHYVPILTGILENDGSVRTLAMINNNTEIKRFNDDFNGNLAVLLDVVEKNAEILDEIIEYYFNGKLELHAETFDGFEKVVSDRAFIYPFYDTIRDLLKFSNKPVSLYKFDRRGPASFSSIYTNDYINPPKYGTVHGDDLLELFYLKIFKKLGLETNDDIDNSPFFDYILKFVTEENLENFEICTLEVMNAKLKENRFCSYMNFGDIVELKDSFRVKDAKFWDKLFDVRNA